MYKRYKSHNIEVKRTSPLKPEKRNMRWVIISILSIQKSPWVTGNLTSDLKTRVFAGKEEEVGTNSGSKEENGLRSAKENKKMCLSLGRRVSGHSEP